MIDKSHFSKLGVTLFAVVLFFGFISMLSSALFATRPATSVAVDEKGKALLPSVNEAAVPAVKAPAAAPAAGAAPAEQAAAEPVVALEPFIAVDAALITGDAAVGETLFVKNCKTCHRVDGKNAVGPSLAGVVGRATGTAAAFKYSPAMKAHVGHWTPERLTEYLTSPKTAVPKNKMAFNGFGEDTASITNVIAYLYSLGK